jgi:energy-coupling factor transporter ATP-binding protein EcfA2
MRLTNFRYVQSEDEPGEWVLDGLTLGAMNLLVGKNASGKSRTLSVIHLLARLIAGDSKITFKSAHFSALFDHNGERLHYELNIHDFKVLAEEFSVGAATRLRRGAGGIGLLHAVKLDKEIEFQSPEQELAAVARRDSLQHPFFEPLHEWGKSLRFYPFGTALGRDRFGLLVKDFNVEIDDRDSNNVIAIFRKGCADFPDSFKQEVVSDMKAIDYDIDDVGLMSPGSIKMLTQFPGELRTLFVKERTLDIPTEQVDMSQGMFRVLSLLIQLNYSKIAQRSTTVLIDDIGEGMDFERSCALINLLMAKYNGSNIQLIMATNDRFVMNTVPLETWSILQRSGHCCRVFNHDNSTHAFDEFKFTGLNNFDFFATDFINESQDLLETSPR